MPSSLGFCDSTSPGFPLISLATRIQSSFLAHPPLLSQCVLEILGLLLFLLYALSLSDPIRYLKL